MQFKHQKPYLISHFYMKMFMSFSACANAWIIRMRECPNWLMAHWWPAFVENSLTDGSMSPFFNLSVKAKSRIARKSQDLWGIIAIGENLNSSGGLSFILSHKNTLHLPLFSFTATSSASIFINTICNVEMCGPRSIFSYIWFKVQGFPVILGHPFIENCSNFPTAG